LEVQGGLDYDLQVCLFLSDVAKRVLDPGRSHDPRSRPSLGPFAAHVEPDVACKHLESLLLVGVVMRGHIAAGVSEYLCV
jgi:hypothetical protein